MLSEFLLEGSDVRANLRGLPAEGNLKRNGQRWLWDTEIEGRMRSQTGSEFWDDGGELRGRQFGEILSLVSEGHEVSCGVELEAIRAKRG